MKHRMWLAGALLTLLWTTPALADNRFIVRSTLGPIVLKQLCFFQGCTVVGALDGTLNQVLLQGSGSVKVSLAKLSPRGLFFDDSYALEAYKHRKVADWPCHKSCPSTLSLPFMFHNTPPQNPSPTLRALHRHHRWKSIPNGSEFQS